MEAFPDARTEVIGVVGHPVGHSLSPAFWNPALRHDKRNAVFLAFDVRPQDFRDFVGGMRAAGVRGLNVTMPHKAAAFSCADEASEDAERIESANVMVFDGGHIGVHNTDVEGIRLALEEMGVKEGVGKALVVGAGGAGRAAVLALTDGGAGEVFLANRTMAKAELVRQAVGPAVSVLSYGELADAAADVDVLIHTTSVGLDGETEALAPEVVEAAASGGCRALLDVVYAPSETALVRSARRAGLEAADGLAMLVHQAAAAYRLILGDDPPFEEMHRAAWAAAGRS